MSRVAADEVQWENGCVSGAVYWGDESLTNLLVKVCIFVSYVSLANGADSLFLFLFFFVTNNNRSGLLLIQGLRRLCVEQSPPP